jgi:hypothetical protein
VTPSNANCEGAAHALSTLTIHIARAGPPRGHRGNLALWSCKLPERTIEDARMRSRESDHASPGCRASAQPCQVTEISFSTYVAPGADHAVVPARSRAFHVVTCQLDLAALSANRDRIRIV